MIHIGIDPGRNSGGIAVIVHDSVSVYHLEKLTDDETDEVIKVALRKGPVTAWLEDPRGVFPGQRTPKSIAGPAESFGFLRGLLVAAKIKRHIVRPREWQKPFKLPTRKDAGTDTKKKRAHREAAQRLFPEVNVTNWNADALLLAEFGRRKERQ